MAVDWPTFLGIVLVLTVAPGADMALVMRHVLAYGLRSAWPTLLGIETGLAIHVTASVAGLSVLLRDSHAAFTTVKLAGAAWLGWLGVSAIVAAVRAPVQVGDDDLAVGARSGHEPAPSTRTLYVRGLLTNVLNVKIALFYIAFLPQFAPRGDRFVPVALTLAAIQAVIGLAWLSCWALLVARSGDLLETRPGVRRAVEVATGCALVGFGIRLALVAA